MATTGTDVFTLTRDELISASLRVIRVLQDGQTATANQLSDGSQALNIFLKNLQTRPYPLIISKFGQISFTTVANQASYTIGPSGADVTSVRPLRVLPGSFIRTTATLTDVTLENISRQAFLQASPKATAGSLTQIYYFPGITIAANLSSPGTGWGTLYLLQPVATTAYTINLNVQLPVFDMTSGTNEIDLPKEYFAACKWGLAAELADEYEVPEERCIRLRKIAEMYIDQLTQWQKTTDSTDFGEDIQAADNYTIQLMRQNGE